MEQVREDPKAVAVEQDAVDLTAAGFAMIGMLVGLMTLFVMLAPGS